jgi:Sulfotransferase family
LPIFVLATARSYSSVVTTMIGQHPDLVGLPELKLFCCRTIGELEASLPRFWIERGITHRSPGLVRALSEFEFGDQTPESLSVARAWLNDRQHWSGSDVLDVLLARLSPRVGVEKSPENVLSGAALRRMASAYPNARYLHLTRHPVTTQRSMQEHRNRTIPSYPQDGEPMSGIASWYDTHRRILHFSAKLPPDRYLRVRAEDVLNDTEPQLRAIAAWLGLRADDGAIEAMKHPEASPFARPGPAESGIVGGHDPSFLRDPIPHRVEVRRTLDAPQNWAADPSVWRMVVDLANRLGYFDEGRAMSRSRRLSVEFEGAR